jgi:hydroxymethylglutaryl-CoA reductase
MQITAAGFGKISSLRVLTTKGISIHMKMHLQNILNQEANESEKEIINVLFDKRTVSHLAVVEKLNF